MAEIHALHPDSVETEQQETSQQPAFQAPVGAQADMPATAAKIMSDADWSNHELLDGFHARTEGLAEKINQLTGSIKHVAREEQAALARWDAFGDARTHWSVIQPWLVWALLLVLMVSETALAATVMAGLDLTDGERYLVALGTVVATTFGVKAMAYAWRRHADDEHASIALNPKEKLMLWLGLFAILLVLAGQVMARESYAEQVQASGGGGVTTMVAVALTLLQAGLYLAVGVSFFWLMPHVRTHEAELQYRHALKELQALHRSRQALAGKLNRHVLTLKSNWALNQAKAKSGVYEHMAELGLHLEKGLGAFYFDERLFKPVPDWVWPVVDPLPQEVQSLVEEGPLDKSELKARAEHRERVVHGKSAPAQAEPATSSVPPSTPATTAEAAAAEGAEHADSVKVTH